MSCFNALSLHTFSFSQMLFSLHYLELYITDSAVKVSRFLYWFTTYISHGVENYFPRLFHTGISDAVFSFIIDLIGFECIAR